MFCSWVWNIIGAKFLLGMKYRPLDQRFVPGYETSHSGATFCSQVGMKIAPWYEASYPFSLWYQVFYLGINIAFWCKFLYLGRKLRTK
jgi:dipeptide/tripeptide permease